MPKQYRKSKQQDLGKTSSYNTLKHQLELETENLLRQRNMLGHGYAIETIPSQKTNTQRSRFDEQNSPYTYPPSSAPYREGEKKKIIKGKIEEIIKMCKAEKQHERQHESSEYTSIIEAEKQILDYLSAQPGYSKPLTSHPHFLTSPHTSPHHNTDSNPHTFKAKSQKSSIREQLKQNTLLGDDAMEMIEEIERKALVEIDCLRSDKIQVLKKLNKEIKLHNEEKKRCLELEAEVRYLREELSRYANQRRSTPIHAPQAVSQMISRKPSEHHQFEQPSPRPIKQHSQENQLESEIVRLEEENAYMKHVMNQQPQQSYYQPPPQPVPSQPPQQSQQPTYQPTYQSTYQPTYQSNYQPNYQSNYQFQKPQPQSPSHHHNPQSPTNNNQQLKAELAALEGKVRNYETILRAHDMGKGSELDYLWGEGFELSEEGKKILRIKSKPEFGKPGKGSSATEEKQKQRYLLELTNLKKKISSLQEQNSYLQQKSKQPESPSQHNYIFSSRQNRSPTYPSYTHKPTTSQFERIINEMKKVSYA